MRHGDVSATFTGTSSAIAGQADRVGGGFSRRDGLYLALIAGAILLAGYPLLQGQLTSGHDAGEYTVRLAEFERGLRDGNWLPRWAPDVDFGYGSPIFVFLPPLVYYLAAIPRLLGADLIVSLNVAGLAIIGASGLGMYLLAREFYGREGGLLAAVGYLFAPFFLVTLYVRHAFTDFSALAVLPFCCWSTVRLAAEPRRSTFVLCSLSSALLLAASFSASLIAFPLLCLWPLGRLALRRDVRGGLLGLGALALGGLLSAVVWLPALLERSDVHAERLLQGESYFFANHFVYPQQLLFSAWGYGISVPGPNDGFSFALGSTQLALSVVGMLLLWWRCGAHAGTRDFAVWMGLALAYACLMSLDLSRPLWDALPGLQYLQFPWRYLLLAAFAVSALAGLAAAQAWRIPWAPLLIAAVGLALILAEGLPHAHPQQLYTVAPDEFAPESIARRSLPATDADEYQPIAVTVPPAGDAAQRLQVISGTLQATGQQLRSEEMAWRIGAATPARVRILTFYYPGWRAYVDGAPLALDVEPLSGVMLAEVPAGSHSLLLRLEDTPARVTAKAVTALGAALLLLVGWLWQRLRLGDDRSTASLIGHGRQSKGGQAPPFVRQVQDAVGDDGAFPVKAADWGRLP